MSVRRGIGVLRDSIRSIRWRMLQIFCELRLAKKGAPPGCVWNRQPIGLRYAHFWEWHHIPISVWLVRGRAQFCDFPLASQTEKARGGTGCLYYGEDVTSCAKSVHFASQACEASLHGQGCYSSPHPRRERIDLAVPQLGGHTSRIGGTPVDHPLYIF